jgi:hypothetical protein
MMERDLEALAREDLGADARPELIEAWIAGWIKDQQGQSSVTQLQCHGETS